MASCSLPVIAGTLLVMALLAAQANVLPFYVTETFTYIISLDCIVINFNAIIDNPLKGARGNCM